MSYRVETDAQATRRLILSGLTCVAIFLATIPLPRSDGHLVGSDGLSYYAIVRSLVVDRDFNFTNDHALLGISGKYGTAERTGLPANPFAVGPALLWAPFFAMAHSLALLLNKAGASVPVNGVDYFHEAFVCVSTILYATAGFVLTCRVLKEAAIGSPNSRFWSVMAMWWATPAIYYMIAEPSMAHGLTVFTMAVFLYAWFPASPNRSVVGWGKVGAAAGLVALTRWQEAIILMVPVAEILWWAARRQLSLFRGLLSLAVVLVSMAVMAVPQMIMWKIVYGAAITMPQGPNMFSWSQPNVLQTLFSTRHGLVSWHPIFLVSLLGLPLLARTRSWLAFVAVFMFVGELLINASITHWWGDLSFGQRRFTCLAPLLCAPLASVLALGGRRGRWATIGVPILIVWNGLALLQYRAGLIPMDGPLTIKQMTIERLTVPLKLFRRFLG